MSGLENKNKTICFRLSEAELDYLKKRYPVHGARNVSDLIRIAVERLVYGGTISANDVTATLATLDVRIGSLESRVSILSEQINNRGLKPEARPAGGRQEKSCFESALSGTATGDRL